MDIQVVISQMAVLFILIGIGYVAGKIKLLTPEAVKVLSNIVLNISTPSTILYSVMGDTGGITGGKTVNFLLFSLLAYALLFVVGVPSSQLLSAKHRDRGQGSRVRGQKTIVLDDSGKMPGSSNRGLYCCMIAFGNTGFMGIPIGMAIFGTESMFYLSVYNIIFQVLVYSVGIVIISGKGSEIKIKTLINAAFVASILAFIIAFTDFRTPFVISDALRLASGLNTPCAMFVIGATLSRIPVKDVFVKWRLYPITFLKIIAAPVLVWLVLRQFVTDELMLGILVVLSAMPTAAAVPMISIEYGGDEKIASSGVFLSTLLSGLTIPLIVYMLLI